MRRIGAGTTLVFAALIAVSASAQPNTTAAPDQATSPPALAKGPAALRASAKAPAPKPGSPAWKYRDCLKRYKDHDGCRYLAYRKKPR